MKVLCFTPSYKRPEMIRRCMLEILNQSYTNIFHTVNITHDALEKLKNYKFLYNDLDMNKIKITYNINSNQQTNDMLAIKAVDYNSFDIFVKVDDDDMYKKNYVKNIIDAFSDKSIDIISSKLHTQLNGTSSRRNIYSNLGLNPKNYDYCMPMTLAFNKKALKVIMELKSEQIDDIIWRNAWSDSHLKHKVILNNENVIWHVHGKNLSTASFLDN